MSNTTIYKEIIEDVDNQDSVTYIFDSEQEALTEASSDLLNKIRDNWDIGGDDMLFDAAKEIQDLIRNNKLRSALEKYNDTESDRSDCCPHYIYVNSDIVRSTGTPPSFIDWSDYRQDDEDEDYEEDEEEEDDSPYVASTPGAVCRGPCKNPSPDAYADRRDGTYVCYQCKLFGGVFGNP